jgi:drug/metabolite transporter (DMT)-like permease
VISTGEFFVMICEIKQNKLRTITLGAMLAVVIMFILMSFFVHPKHLFGMRGKGMGEWTTILISCAITAGVKFWLLAWFSKIMRPDGLAIFECVHPIATLASDLLWERDSFEWIDGVAIIFFLFGWILYPKMNI